jgi:hypothetical protein
VELYIDTNVLKDRNACIFRAADHEDGGRMLLRNIYNYLRAHFSAKLNSSKQKAFIVRSLRFSSHLTNSVPPEPEISSPLSQQPASNPYPEPGESTSPPPPPTNLPKAHLRFRTHHRRKSDTTGL